MSVAWTQQYWDLFASQAAQAVVAAPDTAGTWAGVVKPARRILRQYSSSFFVVTRFLPAGKREQVEVIYSAVRYPDEIVDTFPLCSAERLALLDRCARDYETAITDRDLRQSLTQGVNPFLAGFAEVVRRNRIPVEHYRAFLGAMRLDVQPRYFADLDDLVDNYIYGSATVVGYFLAYVYGASSPTEFSRALEASRELAIALQLTNFLRDVGEDRRRGRVYLPLSLLREEGLRDVVLDDPSGIAALTRVLHRLSGVAERHYAAAEQGLESFAPDCRVAIQACIDVYRQLNQRVGSDPRALSQRQSVPTREKFRVLPSSKYWRIPMAYLVGM